MTSHLIRLARRFEEEAKELEAMPEWSVSYDAATNQTREVDEIDAERWEVERGCAVTALIQMAEKLRKINVRLNV